MKLPNWLSDKKSLFLASLTLAVVFFAVTLLFFIKQPASTPAPLTQEQLAQLVKPTVVRILQHVQGNYTLPVLKVNLNALTFNSSAGPNKTLDQYVAGSGFIVSSDGYIISNAHVIAPEMSEGLLLKDAILSSLKEADPNLTDQDIIQLSRNSATANFLQQLYDFAKANATFNFSSQVAVLNPSSSRENLEELFRVGLPAAVVDYDKNFLDNERDVGLLKIAQTNLPTLGLEGGQPQIGDEIYISSFPATADFNNRAPLESTFTQGVVSAIKASANKDFKIFQTDAKISEGSSGGPLFNKLGQAEGIITFQTDNLARQNGDNFAFAIPIQLAFDLLNKNQISLAAGNYASHFKAGLAYLNTKQCQKAVQEFNAAEDLNYLFPANKLIANYIDACQKLTSSGKSLDTPLALWQNQLANFTGFEWFVIVGRVMLAGFGVWVLLWLLGKLKQDEGEILSIEQRLKSAFIEKRRLGKTGPASLYVPLPEQSLYHLGSSGQSGENLLTDYFAKAHQVGLSNNHIIEDLKKAGWDDETINQALINTNLRSQPV